MVRTSKLRQIRGPEIRRHVKIQRRTVSGSVRNIAMRSVDFDDDRFARVNAVRIFRAEWVDRGAGPGTTVHLHCSGEEAKRVRHAAKR